MVLMISVFVLLIVCTFVGVYYSRRLCKAKHPLKNLPFTIFFSVALISGIIYVFGAKKIKPDIDVTLSWMIFTMGGFFAAGMVFFSAFFMKKEENEN
ncbi:hypothetical protein J6TS2_36350 [Heyndrickxia sporothermodurans]|nr:hypothetical protein J6TS2_36350 [Heyndrickxia sporothermodurans]